MKYLYTIIAIMILASCTSTETPVQNEDTTKSNTGTEITTNEIDAAISELDEMDTEENNQNNIIKVDATYKNPNQDVDMVVSYSLDSEGKIEMIEVSATNWDLTDYNNAAQEVVGKTLEEASTFGVSGGSETNAAFQNALKQ